jgi:hypothetical protein
MRFVLFLSRIAFICNIFSLFAIVVLWKNIITAQAVVSTIGIIGYFLAVVFNPLVNFLYLVLLLRKKLFINIPGWLVIANFIFLLLQLQYILFLNDKLHT